ncbi:nuclear body protein SP140-like isoform X1 [Esox lucius]|uniref:Nuclear body protein SP140-like protein n=1 Tax=Esox lucius TaxID=8010 RepID=A0A6Q2XJS7_ESOLU|nr:nuclear body protein SP140-like isoform X1 [Esox lucius]
MDPLDFVTDDQLLRFFRCSRTEMSCMEQPHIFLYQLRDHNLIPEEVYKKLIRKKSKEQREKGLYDMLNWLEEKRPDCIKLFWRCVFKDHLLQQYPTLRLLRNSLLDGSFTLCEKLPEKMEKKVEEEVNGKKRKYSGEGEEEPKKKKTTVIRKRQTSKENESGEEEEQPSTSTQSTPSQKKKVQKPVFSSPLKKGETADIWTWPFYKTQLPVTCGDKKATLYRDKLARGGEDCILVDDQWFTLAGFEEFGGKKSSKNWKTSIRCEGITLAKLIQEGHLISPSFKRRKVGKIKTELFPSNKSAVSSTDSEYESDQEEDDEEVEVENEKEEGERGEQSTSAGGGASPGGSQVVGLRKIVFQVTCGVLSGMLHKDRFASGTRGKSVRTERSWMTPMEFLRGASVMAETSWKKDILCDGNPLSVLIENKVLIIHSVLCKCKLCNPTAEDLQEQVNDDDCFICRIQGSLICCDECPRSFHQGCHLPNVDDALLGNDRPWVCTFCILRNTQSWRQPSKKSYQDVLNYRTSDRLLECQYLLLCLYHTDEDQIFVKNPSINVRNYSSMIKTPMWLDGVVEKLQNSQYQTVKAFVADVLLIFTNCAAFNRDNSEFREMGERLADLFEREFRNTFSIQQQ